MLIRATIWLLVFLLAMGQPATLLASDYFGQVTFNGLPVPGATVTATQGRFKGIGDDGRRRHLPPGRACGRPLEADDRGVRLRHHHARDCDPDERRSATGRAERPLVRRADARAAAGACLRCRSTREDEEPVNLTALTGPAGMGAADGLLINGSLNNGASTRFALPRGIGNNRPRPRGVYSYAAGFQMGSSAWDARPFSLIGSQSAKPSYADTQALGTFQGPLRVRWLRNPITLLLCLPGHVGDERDHAVHADADGPGARGRLFADARRPGHHTGMAR